MVPTSVQSASGEFKFMLPQKLIQHEIGSDLIMEFRVGRSGLGDDWLYRYTPGSNWTLIGRYLEGVNSAPFPLPTPRR